MSDSVESTVRVVARRIEADLSVLTTEMTAMFVETIPEFRHDDAVRQIMVASTASNLTAIVDLLALGISLDDITVPPAAAEYARRFAQHDLPVEGLLRAYHLGEHMLLQWAMYILADLRLPTGDTLAAVSRIAMATNGYIDRVTEALIAIYESERNQWDTRSDAARAARVRAVLTGDGLDLAAAEQMLGVPLRGWHLAAILWIAPGTPEPAEGALRTGVSLLATATRRTPFVTSADEQTLWAWVSSTARPSVDLASLAEELRTRPALRVALGEPASGLDGFRRTFHDAQQTRTVAVHGTAQLTRYSDVSLAALVADDSSEALAWARRTLGDLASPDPAMTRLRETVRVFLDARGSYTDAAARLHVHKNTIHYRIRKAEQILGHPLTQHRLPTEAALHLHQHLTP
ncbi:helix-turn-helix domain-containing protein [Actinocorallia sp. API 0066]|uniref:PucR family transcriptional regulator n=1 Tax=Actinocorallia sp. API 0066 TaxID=2896846 RepID=UPI001E5D9A38|nr:helix-turn-helix domain-containing protein [Actinocorallia sp. API 0066]MCD0449692.1 helix-turn-helix domain-containing protein [Actinocorallia sp. API 0066]